MAREYIATTKSKQIIKDARKAEKNGEIIDWEKVLEENHNARAKTKEEKLKTAGRR